MREALVRAMKRRGFSYRALAFKTGLDASYLCRVVHEHRRPSREAAERIGDALGLKPWTVLEEPRGRAGATQ